MVHGSLFRRFKDAARLKHLDPLDISSNYQCPIYVYEICGKPLSTYLLCSSPIDDFEVPHWVAKQKPVSEYNVYLNEVQTGWFTTTKSVFINDVRFLKTEFGKMALPFSLDHLSKDSLKTDESIDPIHVEILQQSNNMQLSFNYLPGYEFQPGDLNNLSGPERDCSTTFKYHWESIKWKKGEVAKNVVIDSKCYGLTKYVIPSKIVRPQSHDDVHRKDVLLILRPVDHNSEWSLWQHLSVVMDEYATKSYRAIMHNADQFLLDLNDISKLPDYEEDVPEYSEILEFKRRAVSNCSSDFFITDPPGPFRLVRIPFLMVVKLPLEYKDPKTQPSLFNRRDSPKVFILSTTPYFDIRDIVKKANFAQETLVAAHRPIYLGDERFEVDCFNLAFGEQCKFYSEFHNSYLPQGDSSNLKHNNYVTRGIHISSGLEYKSVRENFLEIMSGYYDIMGPDNSKICAVYSFSKIEVPNGTGHDMVLIFKQCDLRMDSVIRSTLDRKVTKTRMIQNCFFLDHV